MPLNYLQHLQRLCEDNDCGTYLSVVMPFPFQNVASGSVRVNVSIGYPYDSLARVKVVEWYGILRGACIQPPLGVVMGSCRSILISSFSVKEGIRFILTARPTTSPSGNGKIVKALLSTTCLLRGQHWLEPPLTRRRNESITCDQNWTS